MLEVSSESSAAKEPPTTDSIDSIAAVIEGLRERGLIRGRRGFSSLHTFRPAVNTADAITDYVNAADIDLIVMGTNGRCAVVQLLVGSVAERAVARRTTRY